MLDHARRKRLIHLPFAWLLVTMLAGIVHADDGTEPRADVRELLSRMASAMRGLDYEGTFIYRRAEHVDTLQVFHRGSGDVERERLVTLDGKAREIVRVGEDVQCILPDRRKVLVGHQHRRKPFPSALFDNPETLFPYYRFERGGTERIAGRDAQRIEVLPRDDYRFGHHLWVDALTGLLLRSDVVDDGGEVVEQILFTNLAIDADIQDAQLVPSMALDDFVAVPDTSGELDHGLPEWLTRIPAGYQLVNRKQRRVGADRVRVDHLMFSDGLSSVSLFIDPAPQRDDLLRGATRHGVANAYGVYHDGAHVTVVGEVPPAAIEFIAAGLGAERAAE